MRRTKIICTMGPANDDERILKEMMLAGMNAARFNFSHSTHEAHKKKLDMLVRLREELGLPISAILDTKGPEIRVKKFRDGAVTLNEGDTFVLTSRDVEGDSGAVSITYADLPKDIRTGDTVLMDDGLIGLRVTDLTPTDIICRVENGGEISDNKGINVPNTRLSMPYVSERDYEDIVFGIEQGFDYIAASFVRTADDILEIRRILEKFNCHSIGIIAKIENCEGVENLSEIIRVADGVMVARGDMGVEIPFEQVPALQKKIIRKVSRAGKLTITATQMLESMVRNPRPTRAEAADIANAIYDGTGVIMLSGETAKGKYPVEAVKTMVRVAECTEGDIDYYRKFQSWEDEGKQDITSAISHATCMTAHDIGAKAIVTVTKSGRTARMISRYRPPYNIIGCADTKKVWRQLGLVWGVTPIMIGEEETSEALFDSALDAALDAGIVEQGDLAVITCGLPVGVSGTTNLLKVQSAGHMLISGKGVTSRKVSGNLCVCQDSDEARKLFRKGDILVIPHTDNGLLPLLREASGLVTEQEGANSHGAIVGLAMDLPTIVGAKDAARVLSSGTVAVLDAEKGVVSRA